MWELQDRGFSQRVRRKDRGREDLGTDSPSHSVAHGRGDYRRPLLSTIKCLTLGSLHCTYQGFTVDPFDPFLPRSLLRDGNRQKEVDYPTSLIPSPFNEKEKNRRPSKVTSPSGHNRRLEYLSNYSRLVQITWTSMNEESRPLTLFHYYKGTEGPPETVQFVSVFLFPTHVDRTRSESFVPQTFEV